MGGSRVYETQEAHSATVRMLGHTECLLDAAIVMAQTCQLWLGAPCITGLHPFTGA